MLGPSSRFDCGAAWQAAADWQSDWQSALLAEELGQPFERVAREMIVLELYRRSLVSSSKAAHSLVSRASILSSAYFRFTEDEWQTEVAESKRA
jgi:hypothetical protein